MKRKKLLCRSFAAFLLSTVLATGVPSMVLPGLKAIPVISDTSITAEAASKCYSIENGTMTLMNKVSATKIKELKNKDQITKIVASEGTVLPESCANLFSDYMNVTSMDLSKADTSRVTSMKYMFSDMENLVELNISGFNTSKVKNMSGMFSRCYSLAKVGVSGFDTSRVTNMNSMFYACSELKELDVSRFNTSKVTNMGYMFAGCSDLKQVDLSHFDTSNVTNMEYMFCEIGVESLDLSHFDTHKVTNMELFLAGLYNVTELDVSMLDTSNVTNMKSMFSSCRKMKSLNLGHMDTSNVTNMSYMFSSTESLIKLDLTNFNTQKVRNMEYMFSQSAVKQLNLSSFNTSNIYSAKKMFGLCQVGTLILGPKFGNITEDMELPNGKIGWARGSVNSDKLSGDGKYAVFQNSDLNTYYKIAKLEGTIEVTKNPVYGGQVWANVKLPFLSEDDLWEDRVPRESLQYKWYRDKELIPNEAGDKLVLQKADIGKIITCVVSDKYGIYQGTLQASSETPVDKATRSGVRPQGLTVQDISVYGANDGKIFGVDTSMEYRKASDSSETWIACTSNTISNLKSGTYRVRYKETDTHKSSGSADVYVSEGRKVLNGNVTITGTLKYGQTLTAKVSAGGVGNLSYQWKRGNSDISGATESTYKLVQADIGQVISCVVKGPDSFYTGSISAKTSAKIEKADGPAAPTGLTGVAPAKKGGSDGKITGVKTNMEYASKPDFSDKKACTSTTITGLKAGTYYVRIAETATTKAGTSVKVTVADGKAPISGKVAITGTLKYGQTLTAKVSDSNASKFTYQWKRGSSAISGATASTYKLVKADIGQVISCVVKDASGNTIGSLSAKTSAKIAKADGPAAPTGLNGVAPTKKGGSDGQIVGVKTTMEYSTKSDFSANVVACTSTTIKNLKAGTYYVRIKATDVQKVGKAAKVVVPAAADPADNKNGVTKIFKDVKAGEWYVSAIQFVYDRKYMSGVSSNLFGTNTAITREQFVTVLYNVEGQPSVKYRKVFKDVADKQFYSKAVIWAYDNKITKGISDTVFGTGNNISREQLATMIYNYAQYKKLKGVAKNTDLSSFPDYKKVSSWAKEGMTWAVSNGVVNGKASNGKNYLDPAGKATRAECAQMIKNLFDKVIKK